jgi:hypothetical protein
VKNTTTSFLGNTCALLCYQCLLLRHVLDSGSRAGVLGGRKAAAGRTKRSRVFEEVEEESEDELVDVTIIEAPRQWSLNTYQRDRAPQQYERASDTNDPFFHTQVQRDAFYGHLLDKVVFKHQWIDFIHMADYNVMYELVQRFEDLGIKEFMEHKCDWNDTVIRQFYATVEIVSIEEKLTWMTGKNRYEATFEEFATVNKLNYNEISQGVDITDESYLTLHEIILYHEPPRTGIHSV